MVSFIQMLKGRGRHGWRGVEYCTFPIATLAERSLPCNNNYNKTPADLPHMKSIVSPVYSGQLTAHIQPFLTQMYSLNTHLLTFLFRFYFQDCSLYFFMFLGIVLQFLNRLSLLFLNASGSCTPFSKRLMSCAFLYVFGSCTPFLDCLCYFLWSWKLSSIFKGTAVVISSDLPLKKGMPNSQRYPLNFYLTNSM